MCVYVCVFVFCLHSGTIILYLRSLTCVSCNVNNAYTIHIRVRASSDNNFSVSVRYISMVCFLFVLENITKQAKHRNMTAKKQTNE